MTSYNDFERLCLSVVINNQDSCMADKLKEAYFKDEHHKEIVRAIKDIVKEGGKPDLFAVSALVPNFDYQYLEYGYFSNFDYFLDKLRERCDNEILESRLLGAMKEPDRGKRDNLLQEYLDERRKAESVNYLPYLEPYGVDEAIRDAKTRKEDLRTGYSLKNSRNEDTEITLPSGALTFICAQTSHGKSTFLRNITQEVSGNMLNNGSVLYYTYEEERFKVFCQMLNAWHNKPLNNGKGTNLSCIEKYFKGEQDYINRDALGAFEEAVTKFGEEIKDNKLRLFYADYYLDELVRHIRAIANMEKVDAVFIDYIQLIHVRNNKDQRREELRVIAQSLRKLAIELQIPIVMGAQLNREAKSPVTLCNEQIAESVDIAREANTIIMLWNSSFSAEDSKELAALQDRHSITFGTGGKMYAIMTKNRGGERGISGAIPFNGNTGRMDMDESKCYTSNKSTY